MNIEEAKRIGMRWKMLGDELTDLLSDTMNAVPKNSVAYRWLAPVEKGFLEAKSKTENEFFENITGMNKDVFYGFRLNWHDEFMRIVEIALTAQECELEERNNKPMWAWVETAPMPETGNASGSDSPFEEM